MAVDKLVDSTQLDADLTSVANAIRAKSGGSGQLSFPSGFVSEIDAIPTGGGGEWTSDGIAAGTEPSGDITITGSTIAIFAFAGKPITSIRGDNVTNIESDAFRSCNSLGNVSFPNLVSVTGTYIFQQCRSAFVAHFSKLTTTPSNSYMFYNAGTSSSYNGIVVMPAVTSLGSRTFDRCYLDKVDIGPGVTMLNADMFYNNIDTKTVNTLILRYAGDIVTTSNTDRIKGLHDVYVPSALISQYEQATNWSTRVAMGKITFHAIEGSEYENYYADGTPIE